MLNREEIFELTEEVCEGFNRLAREAKEELFFNLEHCIACERGKRERKMVPVKGEKRWVYLCQECFKTGAPIHA